MTKRFIGLLLGVFCWTLALSAPPARASEAPAPPAACSPTATEPCDATSALKSPLQSAIPTVPVASQGPAPRVERSLKPVKLYFFEGEGCPHCAEEKQFLASLRKKYPNLKVLEYEVWHNQQNAQVLAAMARAYDMQVSGVPVTFVGTTSFVGFSKEKQADLVRLVENCSREGCVDPADLLLQRQSGGPNLPDPVAAPSSTKIEIPLFGQVEAASLSLPVMTVVIAGLDSFNPCAFFVLFSLLGILVHAHSRAKMLLVGGIFVFFSGFIYFLFMAAWLNVFLLLGNVSFITTVAGVVSIVIALINVKDFFWFRAGVSLTISDAAKPKLFDRMRKLLKAGSVPSIIAGTVVLAIAANSYELLCTAGFPMVFTRILTLNNLSTGSYYGYLALYNLVYVIPLAVIVSVFSMTLGKRQLTEWEGRVLKLVSGTMMLGLGIMLVWKPELLNNIVASIAVLGAAIAVSFLIAAMARK